MDFHMTLPSNGSYKIFPDNTASEYKIQLNEPIVLTGNGWECGLEEIQYPTSWNSIPKGEYIIVDGKIFEIDEGQYNSFEQLFRYLNERIKEAKEDQEIKEKVRFIRISGKIAILNEGECEISVSKQLGVMMGMDPMEYTEYKYVETDGKFLFQINQSVKSKYPADIQHGINSLYVYCDKIEPQIVGDFKVPLLRIVPVGKGDVVTKYFQNIYYFPVLTKQFRCIEINIKDTTGSPIQFEHGSSYVVLHFRQSRSGQRV